jgi:hypothetical protein
MTNTRIIYRKLVPKIGLHRRRRRRGTSVAPCCTGEVLFLRTIRTGKSSFERVHRRYNNILRPCRGRYVVVDLTAPVDVIPLPSYERADISDHSAYRHYCTAKEMVGTHHNITICCSCFVDRKKLEYLYLTCNYHYDTSCRRCCCDVVMSYSRYYFVITTTMIL